MYLYIGLLSKRAIRVLLFAVLAGIVVCAAFWPLGGEQHAAKALKTKTISQDERFPNYDIRLDKEANAKLAAFRDSAKRTASDIADVRDAFVRGEKRLKGVVPSLKVDYNNDLRTPEVIAPDVTQFSSIPSNLYSKE